MQSCVPFIARCLAGAFITRVLFIIVLQFVGMPEDHSPHDGAPDITARQWFSHLIQAPILETILLQWAPIEVLRRFGSSYAVCFTAGTLPFALLHLVGGHITAFMALASGIWFAYCYLECRPRSLNWAIAATMILHATSNLIFPWIAHIGAIVFP